jgi:photosystem II stability/assembly factor-like uncharacterized protein
MRSKYIIIAFTLLLSVLTKKGYSQWDLLYSNSNIVFHSIHFFSADTGIVSGNNQVDTSWVFRTNDGGMNWDTTRFYHVQFEKMCFPSKDTGYIVAQDSTSQGTIFLYRSVDKGNSWVKINDSIGVPIYGFSSNVTMAFSNPHDGFVASDSIVWRTSDGGLSFTQVSSFPMAWCSNMATSNDTVLFSGDWYLGFTGDGGSTFDTSLIYNPSSYIHISATNNKVYLSGVGNDGAFLFYPVSSYAKFSVYNKLTQNSSWTDFTSHSFINCSELTTNNIFLGARKYFFPYKPILKSIDGGLTYYTQGSSESGGWSGQSANQIECLNDTLCYALLERKIYRTTNGGGPLIELMGVNNIEENKVFSLFPNPTNGVVNINFLIEFKKGKLNVLNTLGEIISSQNLNYSQCIQLDLSNQSKGLYFVSLLTDKGFQSLKIVLE